MVGHGNRQDERQHPNVVHGPNASSHRPGPAQQPNRTSPTARGCYATCEIQSSVRRKRGNQHRKRHERVVVRANQAHGSHLTPSGCYAEQLPLSIRSASLRILPIGSVSMVVQTWPSLAPCARKFSSLLSRLTIPSST